MPSVRLFERVLYPLVGVPHGLTGWRPPEGYANLHYLLLDLRRRGFAVTGVTSERTRNRKLAELVAYHVF